MNSVTGQTLQTLTNVYPAGYSGGVQVAIGNVIAGSGIPDVIVAPGVGQAPFIKIYSVLTGALIESFLQRRIDLEPLVRFRMADDILRRLMPKLTIPADNSLSSERLLEALSYQRRATGRYG